MNPSVGSGDVKSVQVQRSQVGPVGDNGLNPVSGGSVIHPERRIVVDREERV